MCSDYLSYDRSECYDLPSTNAAAKQTPTITVIIIIIIVKAATVVVVVVGVVVIAIKRSEIKLTDYKN